MSKTIRKVDPNMVINSDVKNLKDIEEMPKCEKDHLTKKIKRIDKKHHIVEASDGAIFGELKNFAGDGIGNPLHKKGLKKEKIRKERRQKNNIEEE